MSPRFFLGTAAAVLMVIGSSSPPDAETDLTEYIVPPVSPAAAFPVPEDPFTVLTMAADGSWGVATSIFIGEAISGAMAECKAMSGPKLGCGALSKTGRAAWVLGVRCGRENILVADKILANAELAALNRETELRHVYAKNMPSCVRIVTVDPDGMVVGSSRSVAAHPIFEQSGIIVEGHGLASKPQRVRKPGSVVHERKGE
jgi:hypothetical protein